MKKKYFVQIQADFLLDVFDKLNSDFTQWLYIYLKLQQNYYPNNALVKGIEINRQELADKFEFSRNTIGKICKRLEEIGMLVQLDNDNNFFVLSEKNYTDRFIKFEQRRYETKNAFFQISEEFSKFAIQKISNYSYLRIYYYLCLKNNHFFFPDKPEMEVIGNRNKMSQDLGMNRTRMNHAINDLIRTGFLLESDDKVFTLNESRILRPPKSSTNLDNFSLVSIEK